MIYPEFATCKTKTESKRTPFYSVNMRIFVHLQYVENFEIMYLHLSTYLKIVRFVFILFSSLLLYNFAGIFISNASKISFKSGLSTSINL